MEIRERVITPGGGPSRTKTAMAEECDVNNIMARYKASGMLPIQIQQGQFLDVSQIEDYKSALDMIQEAEQVFRTLPLELRQECHHDPAEFLDFVQNPENEGRMIELGLLDKPPTAVEPSPGAPAEPAKLLPDEGKEKE